MTSQHTEDAEQGTAHCCLLRAQNVSANVRSHRDSRYTMNKQLNIFLLIGQSNMYGCGDIAEVRPLKHPQVSMYQGGQWIPASDPLHVDAPDDPRVGLGMSFATALLNTYPNAEIGLLQCAVGGTPLSRWSPGADLYDNAVDLIRRASSGGILKGILWHQGESDSDTETAASTYGSRLIEMIESLRTDLLHSRRPSSAENWAGFLRKLSDSSSMIWSIVSSTSWGTSLRFTVAFHLKG